MKSNSDIFFSIVTPVKDGGKFIYRYLESLRSQNFKNWEAIIVDDYSKDKSFEILLSQTCNDNRFRILKNDQKKFLNTPYLARNIALDHAQGKYICFLDIDDIWLPNKLKREYEILSKQKKLNLIFSDYYRYLQKKDIYIRRRPITFIKIKNLINFINPIPMLTSCVKAEKVLNIRFKPFYHEDYIFWKELVRTIPSDTIYIDNEPNSIYIVSRKSLSSNKIRTIKWISNIYFLDNRNLFLLFLKLFIRALFQILIILLDHRKKFKYELIYK